MATLAERLLVPGTRVRLRRDSRFYGQSRGSEGRVVDESPFGRCRGWTSVIWDSGGNYRYRIGLPNVDNGACDLDLVEDRQWPKRRLS